MIKIGLTGSVGMGKSETAKMFAAEGVPVFDADAEVHRLYQKGGAAAALLARGFPSVVIDGRVDRGLLAEKVLNDSLQLAKLERIVHPFVESACFSVVQEAEAKGATMIVLDIPLLFEKSRTLEVDVIVVVTAPPEVQRERVLERPGMTEAKFESILKRQTPDNEKRHGADFVVLTDKGLDFAREQVRKIIELVRAGRTSSDTVSG